MEKYNVYCEHAELTWCGYIEANNYDEAYILAQGQFPNLDSDELVVKKAPKTRKHTLKDVVFIKGEEYSFGTRQHFWRADLNGMTIVTMCRTKAECTQKAKHFIKELV